MQHMIIYNILSLFITILLVSLYLHFRLNRKIFDIPIDNENIIQYHNYFFLLFVLSLSIILYIVILHQLSKRKKNLFVEKFLIRIQKYNVFYRAYSLIFDFLGVKRTKYLVKFAKYFVKLNKYKLRGIIIIFVVLPRLFIISILLWEIFIQKKLHYYFYSLFFLFIPLLFTLFVFIFTDLGPRLLPEFQKFLDVGIPDVVTMDAKNRILEFSLKPEYSYMDMDDLMYNFYYPMLFLIGHMDVKFLPFHKKITTYTVFIYFLFHAIVWGYLLFNYLIYIGLQII